jgi:hypothetical protein
MSRIVMLTVAFSYSYAECHHCQYIEYHENQSCFAEHHNDVCHYAVCRYAECSGSSDSITYEVPKCFTTL